MVLLTKLTPVDQFLAWKGRDKKAEVNILYEKRWVGWNDRKWNGWVGRNGGEVSIKERREGKERRTGGEERRGGERSRGDEVR